MYYVIQNSVYREYNYNNLITALKKYNLEYEMVKFLPFTTEIETQTKRKDVFFFGTVSGSRDILKNDWNPGSLYNDSHDFEAYAPHYGKNMLNSDAIVFDAGDESVMDKLPNMFFARPAKDTKAFSGQTFLKSGWLDYIHELKQNSTLGFLEDQTRIVAAPIKEPIIQEIRCWIVDGKVATCSQYKIGDRVNMLNMDNNEEAKLFARDMVKLYCPAKAFVLDICLYDNDYKVVEINCINASGFYDADMDKLVYSLEQAFN